MSTTKELPIQQANEGEGYRNEVVFNSDQFKATLHKYGVRDLFDNKLAIKQDKQKYIFAIDGDNKFAVDGKVNFTTFMDDFYKDLAMNEKRDQNKKAVIKVLNFETKTRVEITYTETANDLKELQENIIENEKLSEKSTDILNVKNKVERLITFYEQERKLADSETSGWIFNTKYDRKDKGLRKIHKTEIDRRLKELDKIKQQIERLENNKGKKYTINRDNEEVKEVKMNDVNAMDMKMTLKQFSDKIEDLGKEAPDFILARNDILLEKGDTVPYYDIVVYDVKDARKVNRSLRKINNNYILLDKLELSAAKRQELSQDLQNLEVYLNNVIDHPDTFKPSEHPFVPTHAKEFYELTKIDPTLAAFMRLNGQAGNTPTENNTGRINTVNVVGNQSNANGTEYTSENYADSKQAFEKGGVSGVINHLMNKSNMKPEQKQFWSGVSNLAVMGGMVFVGWKMISSAYKLIFKKDGYKDGANRARLGIPTALIIGSQARSGEGPMSLLKGGVLTEKLANIFSGKKTESKDQTPQDKETHDRYTEGFPGATALFNGLTYGEMKQFVIKDKDQMKIDPNQYDTLLNMFKSGSKKNPAAAAFLESIGKNDERHVLSLGLTGMGITRDQIEDDTNKSNKFDKAASEAIVRLHSVTEFMNKNGYNKINSETQYLVDKYVANGQKESDLDDLADRGDVFYKEINVTDNAKMGPRIKELAKNDPKKEEELLLAINTFYNQMPTANKKVELLGTRPNISFKTYDQSTNINLENKELVGFTPKLFTSYAEIFKAANLTNRIKSICKDKQIQSEKPFYLSTLGQDITFDNAKIFSIDFDTEIMTAGRGGSLKKVSPTLETDKQKYCDYLNASTPKFWKEVIKKTEVAKTDAKNTSAEKV